MLKSFSSRVRLGPIAASILAGFLCAAAADVVVTIFRAHARGQGGAGGIAVATLAFGLYGMAGMVTAVIGAWLTSGVLSTLPEGPGRVLTDERLDRSVATGILSGLLAVAVMAAFVATGQQMIVRPMQSDRLATIAAGGLVILAAPLAVAIALSVSGALRRWVTPHVPRPARTGATGFLLLTCALLGILAAVGAFSRADWRVLDLAPFVSLAIVCVGGVAHGLFWYGSRWGTHLAQALGTRVPTTTISHVVVATLFVAFVAASRLPESSPAFRSIDEGALGLRLALRLARRASDADGDGFSARFGGGDCNDTNAEIHPGADDVPGNGIDENCEGGDAIATAEDSAGAEPGAKLEGHDEDGARSARGAGTRGEVEAVGVHANPPPGPDSRTETKPHAGTTPTTTSRPFRGNILLITIDAFRADRLGVAGYGRPAGHSLTPNLDALARRGAYFRRVWSQAPNTPRSFPSILTSQLPSSVKWDKPTVNYPVVLPGNHTVFEELKAAGLVTIGVFSHFYFTPERGLSRSFDEWSNDGAGTIAESNKDSASPRLVPRAMARLKKAAARHERFVLWTHLFEPHSSYMVHKEFPPSGGLSGVAGLMEKYDYEIAYVDMWVGRLLKSVADLGLSETTAVVVMADHGEAWGEHKTLFHGQDLFDEQLRIPLIIAIPGRAPIVSVAPVSAMDVAPTLVDLVGGTVPRSFRGRSLLPLIAGDTLPARPVYAELMPATAWPHHAVMMVDDDKKIIHRVSERRWELYDLARDPGEKTNLADDGAQRVMFEALRKRLLSFEEHKR